MGDVDVKEVKNIDPINIASVTGIEPLRVAKIAPAAVHVKELNHIDPITIESVRVDEVRNLEPVRVDRFDVTYLPTVNLTIGQTPALDVNLREIPPLAIGLHQDFVLPSEYFIRARLLGFEFLRVHVAGRTVMHPRDRVPREVSSSHERSYREVSPVGNPGIPVSRHEEFTESVVRRPPVRHRRKPRLRVRRERKGGHGAGISVGAPPHAFMLSGHVESAVSGG